MLTSNHDNKVISLTHVCMCVCIFMYVDRWMDFAKTCQSTDLGKKTKKVNSPSHLTVYSSKILSLMVNWSQDLKTSINPMDYFL
jgi:hypothetical protein